MDYDNLIRDPKRVMLSLVERDDKSVVTKVPCRICFPTRFAQRKLAQLGIDILVIGLFPIITQEKYYSLLSVNAMVSLGSSEPNKVMIHGTEYYALDYEPGSVIIKTLELVQDSSVIFKLYDELMNKGKVPWYTGYEDLARIYSTAKKHAGANVGENPEVIELLVSLIARDPKDRTKYYGPTVKDKKDLITRPPAFIPLRSVQYAATNTVNKIAGSYFSDGVTSALLNPSEKVETIEKILRA